MRDLNRIAVGFDASDQALDALILGEMLARTTGAELIAVRVEPGSDGDRHDAAEQRVAADLERELADSSVRRQALVIDDRAAAKALTALAARDPQIGLVALGSTHRAGLGRVLPGGVAEQMLSGAPCSIAVAPKGYALRDGSSSPADDLRVIAVGFDGSRESEAALELATKIARAAEATMRVITIGRPVQVATGAGFGGAGVAALPRVDLQNTLHDIVASIPADLRSLSIYERGEPAPKLLARAEQGVDLLVMGSRGHGPLGGALLGTTSRAVLADSPCPVVIVGRPALEP